MAQVIHLKRARRILTALACATVFLTVLLTVLLSAQPPDQAALAQGLALSQPMPVDPDLITHTLANGIRTYVHANSQPPGRAELRLVMNVGSVLEDESERGLAHFIEHMAFHGTTGMRPNTLRPLLASIGATSTADANASTSYDQTVYQLRIPVNFASLQGALRILAEWSHAIAFNPADVESERRIVLEEIRQRESANTRMFPVLLKGTRYGERSPGGLPSVVQNATADQLRAFYEKWYRPDLTGAVVVGDFDPVWVDGLVRGWFETIWPRPPAERPTFTVPDHPGTTFAIATDPENTATRVEVHHLLPERDLSTIEGYRLKILDRLFTGMVSARFAEAARQPDAPFVAAGATRGPYLATRGREDAALVATVRDNRVELALGALLDEAKRVARDGFGADELRRQKQTVIRLYERAVAEQATRDSASRANEYIRNFTVGETLPTAALELGLWQRFLPEITATDVNALAADWFASDSRNVLVTAPDKPGVPVVDEAHLAAAVAAAAARAPARYDDGAAAPSTLLDGPVQPGTIVSTVTVPEFGLTEWTLSNGVKVVVKPSSARADEVVMRAVRLGGASIASDEDYPSALAAGGIMNAGGAGRFSQVELRRALTGKVAAVNASVTEFDEGLTGSASPTDLDTLFQLVRLRMTAPRADPVAFQITRDQLKSSMTGMAANPDYQFQLAVTRVLSRDAMRRTMPASPGDLDRWNLEKALTFYRRRFGNADGFTFVFVGNVDLDEMRALAERYLGSLPSSGRSDRWKDDGVRPPGGVVIKTVSFGVEQRSRVSLVFNMPFDGGEKNRAELEALSGILNSQLNTTMRERLGGTYGVSVRNAVTRVPTEIATTTVNWTCDPARVNELVEEVLKAVNLLRTSEVPARLAAAQADLMARQLEQSNRQNAAVAGRIALKYAYGEDVAELAALTEIYRRIDAPAIQHAAQMYLNPSQYVQVVMMPESARR